MQTMETQCCGCFHTPVTSKKKKDKKGADKPVKKVLNFSSIGNTRNGSQINDYHRESRTLNDLKASTLLKDSRDKG